MDKLQLKSILEGSLRQEEKMVEHDKFVESSYNCDRYDDVVQFCKVLEEYYTDFPTTWLLWETLKEPYPEIYKVLDGPDFIPHIKVVEYLKIELDKLKNG